MNKLITRLGQPVFGLISTPVSDINYLDFDYRTPMDKVLPAWRKRVGFNQFQFIGLMDDRTIAGIAIVDLKLVSNLFVYVYDIENQSLYEKSIIHPGGLLTRLVTTPDKGKSTFSGPGYSAIFEVDATRRVRHVALNIGKHIEIDASLNDVSDFEPLRVCSQAGYGRWVFTQKGAGLAASGRIKWNGFERQLDSEKASGSYDWSCGFMRRETSWNWACFSGFSKDGQRVGLNLAAGVNETGVTENAFWLDNKMIKLEMANFVFDRYQPENRWSVTTTDGRLDLSFEPAGKREEKLDVWLLASNFKQMFGHFSGTFTDERGRTSIIERVPGFMEDHYAKW